jgi:hypothetical protein
MGQGSGGTSRPQQQSSGFPGMSNPGVGHPGRLGPHGPGSASTALGNTLAAFQGQGARSPGMQPQVPRTSSGGPLQAPMSPMMQAQMQQASALLMGNRPGSGSLVSSALSGLQPTASGSALLPAHPGSGSYSNRTPMGSGAASPALGSRGGTATMSGNAVPLGSQLPPASAPDLPTSGSPAFPLRPQLSAEANRGRSPAHASSNQGPPRPLSPPAAHQAPTTAHDGMATLLLPLNTDQPPQASAPPPVRGRSGGPRMPGSVKTSSGSRTPPRLSPSPLSAMQLWESGWQSSARPGTPGDRNSPLPGEHLTLRSGTDLHVRGSTPPSPLHAQLSPRVAGPPITTGVAGLATSPSDLLNRSTPPPGAAAVTTGEWHCRDGVKLNCRAATPFAVGCWRFASKLGFSQSSWQSCVWVDRDVFVWVWVCGRRDIGGWGEIGQAEVQPHTHAQHPCPHTC